MARYVRKINGGDDDLYDLVLSGDNFYQECVQKYKNVLSHFFGAKEEIWLSLFMNPVYNLKYVIFAKEFGKTEGKLYSHSGGITDKKADTVSNKIGVIICDLVHQVVAAVDALDEYISSVYSVEEYEASFGCSPILYCDYKALKKREKNCNPTEGGKRAFKEYQNSFAAVDDNAGKISHLLETYWNTYAFHPGNAPEEW
eukprot:12001295-Ditylum_brightwellii.AAC.1